MGESNSEIDMLCKQIASLMATKKMPIKEIAKELNINERRAYRLSRNHRTAKYLKEIGSASLETAKLVLRQETAKLVRKTIEVIEHHLDQKNLAAVPQVLKILGIEKDDDTQKKDNNLTVVLELGDKKNKTIEGEAYEIQDRQREKGIFSFSGEQQGALSASDTPEPVYSTQLSEDDMSYISSSDDGGTEGTVSEPNYDAKE